MKILIAEDDPVSRRLLEAMLTKWGYSVTVCSDGRSAWEILQQPGAPSLAILDWMMPEMDGVQVCREVRKRAAEPYTYVILLTGRSQKHDVVTGLEVGADDYIVKPFHANELRMRLRAGRRIVDLQAQLIIAREELREQATHDSLTRLWNRGAVLDLLEREVERAKRINAPLSVVLADLDHFKRINDTYGHLAGDAVLQEVARRMRAAIRPYDAIGRCGGEEFLMVVPDCDSQGAVAMAERLRLAVGQTSVTLPEGEIPVTLSLGVATSAAGEGSRALISAADAALYRAKYGGRNRIDSVELHGVPRAILRLR